MVAVLLAETCNIGLKAVSRENDPALKSARLEWVKKTYLSKQTITKGNNRLVDYHSSLPLAQQWGGGEVASSDGLRFVVPVKSMHSGFNRKYFGAKRGDPARQRPSPSGAASGARQVRLGIKKYHVLHARQRPVHATAWASYSWYAAGFVVYSGWFTRANHESETLRNHERHGSVQRHYLWIVPLAWLPIQSTHC